MSRFSSRRAFLLGAAGGRAPIRPPWAMSEARFLDACTGCDDCVRACEERIIRRGAGGYPEVDFGRAGCTLCGDCLAACRRRALAGDPESDSPWTHRIAIVDGCLARAGVVCRSCGEACDDGAIRFRPRVGTPALPSLIGERCTGCGQCLARCPADAIQVQRQPVPEAGGGTQARIESSEHL